MLQLRQFHIKFAELGSSMRVLSRAEVLRQQLPPLLFVFQENATNLFPHGMVRLKGHRFDDEDIIEGKDMDKKQGLRELPHLLKELGTGLDNFRQCLDEYRAITDDDAVKSAIKSFGADIKVGEVTIPMKTHVLILSFSTGVPVWLFIQIRNQMPQHHPTTMIRKSDVMCMDL